MPFVVTNEMALHGCISQRIIEEAPALTAPAGSMIAGVIVKEILETFRLSQGKNPWAARPFVQRTKKRKAAAAPPATGSETLPGV